MKTFKIVDGDISDGYHTFAELYEHRCLLFINLCNVDWLNACWKIDQETPGWFLLYLNSKAGQISYHISDKYLGLLTPKIAEVSGAQWDGHTPKDVVSRLTKLASLPASPANGGENGKE